MKLKSIEQLIDLGRNQKSYFNLLINGKTEIKVTKKEFFKIEKLIKMRTVPIGYCYYSTEDKKLKQKFIDFLYKKTGRRYT